MNARIRIDQRVDLSSQPWQIYIALASDRRIELDQEMVVTFEMPETVVGFVGTLRQLADQIEGSYARLAHMGAPIPINTDLNVLKQ